MNNKLVIGIIGVVIIGAIAFFGFSSSTDNSEIVTHDQIEGDVTVTFWHAVNGEQEETLVALADAFNEEWEGKYTVELVNQGSYGDLSSKLLLSADSGELPTMSQSYEDWSLIHHEKEVLVNLEDYISHSELGVNMSTYVDEFTEVTKIDGDYYAMPFNKSTEVMYINENMLNGVGMDVPTTWEEVEEVSKAIYEAYGVPGFGYDSLDNYLITRSYQMNSPYQQNGEINLEQDDIAEAINWYETGITEGWARIAGSDQYLSGPFSSEQVGIYVGSTAGLTFVQGDFIVAPVPGGQSIQQGTNVQIYDTATAEERTVAWEFIKFITNEENTLFWADSTGYLPVNKNTIASDEFNEVAQTNVVLELMNNGEFNFFVDEAFTGSYTARNEIRAMMQEILTNAGNNDIGSILTDYQDKIQSSIDRESR